MYGRFEVRARIPVGGGSWPAIWLLGNKWRWPMNGEIDMMEYYISGGKPSILANACWGSATGGSVWDSEVIPFTEYTDKDPAWAEKFHVWRMDWDKYFIRLYLDDKLLNEIELKKTYNQGFQDNNENPFSNSIEGFGAYILLNLAIGSNGGEPDVNAFPMKYEVDYVRVYQRTPSQP
jgi:beta-glucanase (GH16 family)